MADGEDCATACRESTTGNTAINIAMASQVHRAFIAWLAVQKMHGRGKCLPGRVYTQCAR
jgi:hypothetical protein